MYMKHQSVTRVSYDHLTQVLAATTPVQYVAALLRGDLRPTVKRAQHSLEPSALGLSVIPEIMGSHSSHELSFILLFHSTSDSSFSSKFSYWFQVSDMC